MTTSICADTDAGTDQTCSGDVGPAAYRILPIDAQSAIRSAMRRMHLSAGGDHGVLKASRTIADLEDVDVIQMYYLAEALQHRAWVLDL